MVPPVTLPDVMAMLQTGGAAIAPFLLYAWLKAEARADRERDKHETLAKETVTAVVGLQTTMGTMVNIFTSAQRGGS